ncbi:MAG: 5-formyltetrahydrofolate cyclo-ligase [Verrucomicrobia bacterium]|nr:5-formyltetrahydrofolate cyclo-ligase [Verrucomicrobiota bacterium]MBI3868352.1 5-formyltetrahydrofolate cyclo-ligase [Verrucomicrobiota bacterium]
MKPVTEQKQIAREALRVADRRHGALERLEASHALCERILRSGIWSSARVILAFSPLPREPDIRPLLAAALREGKTLGLPRLASDAEVYAPARVRSLEGDLAPGAHGILEPRPECEPMPTNPLDLVLVPGVGFDLGLGRLGRGLGHYDRMLAGATGIRCGVAFDWQVAASVPLEPHDVRMHCLATPSQWLGPFA